ncbi:hypothetical protein BKA70DRAFT_1449298 [Coprinopsis sp. MPI-PUGE-AT-0042]|nr:hypothetical protein BKA70DRAFT_1449298 [Coprinopsis sp. MPI-PUGE-AT-0042]
MRAWTQIIASIVALVCASSLSVHALPISDPAGVVPLVNTEVIDNAVVKGAGVLALKDRDFNADDELAIPVNLALRDVALAKTEVIDTSVVEDVGVAASADDLPATPLDDRDFNEDAYVGLLSGPVVALELNIGLRDIVLTDPHLSV